MTHTRPAALTLANHVTSLAAGRVHSLAATDDGLVLAWGDNNDGQLGDNTTTDRLTPVNVRYVQGNLLKLVIAVAGGDGHSLAALSNGAVVAWGSNASGQLGEGSTIDRHGAGLTAGQLESIIAVGAGRSHSLAAAK